MNRRSFFALGATGLLACARPETLLAQDRCAPTLPNIEGPFFRAGAPIGTRLASDADGHAIQIHGRVRDTLCRPAQNGVIEVWQADAHGDYDNVGYRHRRQVRCDAEGRFVFETIVPGRYRAGSMVRPAHIHVKVHADTRPTLTTQLYFPGDPHNDDDPWMRSALLLHGTGPDRYGFGFVV
ncbi:MAG: hypothetical protein AB8I08_01970 [Sandaracinaceae bacterium]